MQPHFEMAGLSWTKPYVVLAGDERRLSLGLEKRGDVEKTDLSQVQGFSSFLLYFVFSASDFKIFFYYL